MTESKMGAARARVFEGELARLRGRNELLTTKLNYQGRALQAMGEALSAFANGQKALERRIAYLSLPLWRRAWFQVCAYCRPVWIGVVARDAAPADVEFAIAAADVVALEKMLGTSVRPQPGDDVLIAEAFEAIKAEQAQALVLLDEGGEDLASSEPPHDHELARFEGEGGPAPADDVEPQNVLGFRGKVAVGVLLFSVLARGAMAQGVTLSVAPGVFHRCGVLGDSRSKAAAEADRLKNRSDVPEAAAIVDVDIFARPLKLEPSVPIRFRALLEGAKPGGLETANCHAKALELRDTHLELMPAAGARPRHALVVEITPRWRAAMKDAGEDWSTKALEALRGRVVEFVGWPFYDAEHANAADDTHPGGAHNWRASAWEPCHPCASLRVVR